jgi:hypothetical protein
MMKNQAHGDFLTEARRNAGPSLPTSLKPP